MRGVVMVGLRIERGGGIGRRLVGGVGRVLRVRQVLGITVLVLAGFSLDCVVLRGNV